MRLTIHTERGSFASKQVNATKEEGEQIKALLQESCNGDGGFFSVDTDIGYVVIGSALMKTAVVVVDNGSAESDTE